MNYMYMYIILEHLFVLSCLFLIIHDMTEDIICRTFCFIEFNKWCYMYMYQKFSLSHVSDFLKYQYTLVEYQTYWICQRFLCIWGLAGYCNTWIWFFFLIRCWTRWWIESQPCRVYPECYMTWPLNPRAPRSGSSVRAGHTKGAAVSSTEANKTSAWQNSELWYRNKEFKFLSQSLLAFLFVKLDFQTFTCERYRALCDIYTDKRCITGTTA